jgi:two-component sensor histidine kinase
MPTTAKGLVGDRIHIHVPPLLVGEGSITTLALVVHELATNSLKYGALSMASGSLDLTCTADDGQVLIVWTEKGGPAVFMPKGAPGFGSRLVNNSEVVPIFRAGG